MVFIHHVSGGSHLFTRDETEQTARQMLSHPSHITGLNRECNGMNPASTKGIKPEK